jgi:hypothetical protein
MFWCIICLVLLIAFKKEVFECIKKIKALSRADKIWLSVVVVLFGVCFIWLESQIGNVNEPKTETVEKVVTTKQDTATDVVKKDNQTKIEVKKNPPAKHTVKECKKSNNKGLLLDLLMIFPIILTVCVVWYILLTFINCYLSFWSKVSVYILTILSLVVMFFMLF